MYFLILGYVGWELAIISRILCILLDVLYMYIRMYVCVSIFIYKYMKFSIDIHTHTLHYDMFL